MPDDWYDFPEDPATDPVRPAPAPENDPRDRRWTSLYDINLLAGRPTHYAQREMGVLQKRWQLKFQRAGNGEWKYVEYVPAVSTRVVLKLKWLRGQCH